MSFGEMLDHKCDIYHLKREDTSPGYGLPHSPTFLYAELPDIEALKCHFCINGSRTIIQDEPQAKYQASIKLVVPFGTDIRLNDKVIDRATGYEYTADIPMKVRSHHMYVMLTRKSSQEAL